MAVLRHSAAHFAGNISLAAGGRSPRCVYLSQGVLAVKRPLSSFTLSLVVVVLCGSMALADGFSLWPWGKDETKQVATKRTAQKPAMKSTAKPKEGGLLKWPTLPGLGSSTKTPTVKKGPSTPSMLTRMNQSTKNFFAKTKDVLTAPGMKSQKVASKKLPPTGSHGVAKRSVRPAEEKSGNILTSWWLPAKKEEKKPKSPSEWIGGQRP
jgi:hypothetical protein